MVLSVSVYPMYNLVPINGNSKNIRFPVENGFCTWLLRWLHVNMHRIRTFSRTHVASSFHSSFESKCGENDATGLILNVKFAVFVFQKISANHLFRNVLKV